jgi:hypothetical protein
MDQTFSCDKTICATFNIEVDAYDGEKDKISIYARDYPYG